MAKKDSTIKDLLPKSKTKKQKVSIENIAENFSKKITEISAPFDSETLKKERDHQIRIGRKFIKQAGLSEEELIYFCASLKADLIISNKLNKALDETNIALLEAFIKVENNRQDKIDDLIEQKRKKR